MLTLPRTFASLERSPVCARRSSAEQVEALDLGPVCSAFLTRLCGLEQVSSVSLTVELAPISALWRGSNMITVRKCPLN